MATAVTFAAAARVRGVGWLALAATLGAAACASTGATQTNVVYARAAAPGEASFFSFPIRSGQILLSESSGAHAVLFALGIDRFYRFTHAALLMVEDGVPVVYEYAGAFKPTLATTPPEAIRGGLKRSPLLDYVRGYAYVEVLDPPAGADTARMAARLAEIRRAPPDFDAYGRWGDRQRFFCTEFLAEVLAAGGVTIPPLAPLTRNPSLLRVVRWLGMTDDTTLPAGLLEDPARLVAAFSIWPTRTAVDAFYAAKREVHRRFTVDQKAGDVFELDGHDIKLRPVVAGFLDRAAHLFDGAAQAPSPAEIDRAVTALAISSFGPF